MKPLFDSFFYDNIHEYFFHGRGGGVIFLGSPAVYLR